jgi:PAS domain S-box-containing protein
MSAPTALLAQAFDSAPNGFVLVDEQGLIVSVNQELNRMFGHADGELLGRSVDTLVPPADQASHPGLRQAFMAAPERRPMGGGRVLHALHALGHTFPVEIGLTPLLGPDDARLVLASVVDVSERHALALAFQGLFDATSIAPPCASSAWSPSSRTCCCTPELARPAPTTSPPTSGPCCTAS